MHAFFRTFTAVKTHGNQRPLVLLLIDYLMNKNRTKKISRKKSFFWPLPRSGQFWPMPLKKSTGAISEYPSSG